MVITIGREFGSGGREIGKRLADELNISYYDKEIIKQISNNGMFNEQYVESIIENGLGSGYFYTFGQTFAHMHVVADSTMIDVISEQRKVINKIASTNCVIVGRCADVILEDKNVFRIFVYADEKSKIARCRSRAREGENLTDKEIIKKMKSIDNGRKKLHSILSSSTWGDKMGYDLMVNTSGVEIKKIVPIIANYIRNYFNK
ncbi:MAG: cytidylate kinase-like family protein [Clostridia bacterium]|nr:cytidylate kinase-like family protein [Clostridia bacterium]